MAARKYPNYGTLCVDDCLGIVERGCDEEKIDDFPDGGSEAWLTVFGAFLSLFCSFGQMNAFGTFQSWYTTHQLSDLTPSTIAWIGSVQLWVFFFSVRGWDGCFHENDPSHIVRFRGVSSAGRSTCMGRRS